MGEGARQGRGGWSWRLRRGPRKQTNTGDLMHDIDSTQTEAGGYEFEYPEEMEFENEQEGEEEADFEGEDELEMELAEELLSVSSEEELDQFIGALLGAAPSIIGGIGKLFGGRRQRRRRSGELEMEGEAGGRRRKRRGGGLLKGLGGALKGIAKTALPFVGGALGSVVPGVGTAIGGALGSALGNLFEAELEGETPEDREFDQALRFVRLGRKAVQKLRSIPSNIDPRKAIHSAIKSAAQAVTQELEIEGSMQGEASEPAQAPAGQNGTGPQTGSQKQGGRWIRRGNQIVLLGA